MEVALGGHRLEVVAHCEAVLDLDLGQPVTALAGQFADELLTLETELPFW